MEILKKKWCTFLIYAFIVALPAKVWQLFQDGCCFLDTCRYITVCNPCRNGVLYYGKDSQHIWIHCSQLVFVQRSIKKKEKKKAFEQILLGICGSFHRKRFILQVFTRRVCVIFTQTIAKYRENIALLHHHFFIKCFYSIPLCNQEKKERDLCFLVYKKKKISTNFKLSTQMCKPFLKGKVFFSVSFLLLLLFFWKDSTKSCHLNKRVANELLDVLVNFIIR